MPNPTITPSRLAVLRAVAAGQVKRHRSYAANGKARDTWQVDEYTTKNVASTCDYLANTTPRLIRLGRRTGPSFIAPQVWELTADGERLLANHDTAQAAANKEK